MGYGIFLPQRWRRQPQRPVQINWGHPLANQIASVITPWNISPTLSRVGAPTVNNYLLGRFGGGAAHVANDASMFTDTIKAFDTRATIAFVTNLPFVNAANASTFGIGTSGTGSQLFAIQSASYNVSSIRTVVRTVDGGGISTAEVSASNTYLEYSVWAATYNNTAASLTIYKDGVNLTSGRANSAASGSIASLNNFSLGGVNRGTDSFCASANAALAVAWYRDLSQAELLAFSDNPWQLFVPLKPITYFIPDAGGVTVNTFVGNATAAGQQAGISYDQVLSANVGNATAAGQQAGISYDQVLSANVGNATAAGQQATIVYDQVLPTNVGNATAAGLTADIAVTQRIDTTVGNATAAGQQATIQAATTIDTQVGNATAAGLPAIITVNADINTTVGAATAAGQQASIASNTNINANVGNATAAGQTATLTYDQVLSAGVGNATAAGRTATLTYDQVLAAQKGNATAAGQTATIVYDQVLAAGVGNADAKGWIADIQGAGTINANVGNAVAQGWQASIIEGGGPVTGVRNRIRLRSFTERRRI